MSEIALYNYELDESSYRARLLLSMLGLQWTTIAVDMFPGAEQKKPPMLALSPLGTLPVIRDGDLLLHGTGAILLYLAKAHDPAKHWLPDNAVAFGQVSMWLFFSETALAPAIEARLQALFDVAGDEKALRASARNAFRIMDDHMTARHFDGKEWFVGDRATLADVALFPSFALSRDFGVDHDEYPALRRWIRRFRTLKGFHTMPGIPDYH
ncbi:glutathione S-transferase [Rhizobium sp. Root1203]|jgi:glutathione S-transferase|uniref:glutathione S-transferase family protein n=1 Tax=Rhizobium sp. Root1203 TaxID=1736427 RepID=UPI000709D5B4|nr:glutathione S-transferase family protein [Rhizobium sp. Root1203]KQV12316.1 glutathione S-transferase [Rhizobium sp. Root1203]